MFQAAESDCSSLRAECWAGCSPVQTNIHKHIQVSAPIHCYSESTSHTLCFIGVIAKLCNPSTTFYLQMGDKLSKEIDHHKPQEQLNAPCHRLLKYVDLY